MIAVYGDCLQLKNCQWISKCQWIVLSHDSCFLATKQTDVRVLITTMYAMIKKTKNLSMYLLRIYFKSEQVWSTPVNSDQAWLFIQVFSQVMAKLSEKTKTFTMLKLCRHKFPRQDWKLSLFLVTSTSPVSCNIYEKLKYTLLLQTVTHSKNLQFLHKINKNLHNLDKKEILLQSSTVKNSSQSQNNMQVCK